MQECDINLDTFLDYLINSSTLRTIHTNVIDEFLAMMERNLQTPTGRDLCGGSHGPENNALTHGGIVFIRERDTPNTRPSGGRVGKLFASLYGNSKSRTNRMLLSSAGLYNIYNNNNTIFDATIYEQDDVDNEDKKLHIVIKIEQVIRRLLDPNKTDYPKNIESVIESYQNGGDYMVAV